MDGASTVAAVFVGALKKTYSFMVVLQICLFFNLFSERISRMYF